MPRVFNCVSKDNLFTSDVEATIPFVVEIDSGWTNCGIKNIFAPLEPVVRTKKLRSHRLISIGYLEPSEFGADLPRPLSHIIVNVISSVSKNIAVVGSNITITLNSELIEYWELLLRSRSSNRHENIAHSLALTILNSTGNGISDIVHNIRYLEVSTTDDGVYIKLLIGSKLA